MLSLILSALAVVPSVSALPGQTVEQGELFTVEIAPRPDEYFEHIGYRLWIPPGLDRVRAILILQHGCGTRGSFRFVEDIQYRALAQKWGLAILANDAWQSHDECKYWMLPERGSGAAFFRALDQLGQMSGRSELAAAPWALWGHSGGALWATAMTATHPQRVIATYARSGALPRPAYAMDNFESRLTPPAAMFDVPIMFAYGRGEEAHNSAHREQVALIRRYFSIGAGRSRWALAIDPASGHENGNGRHLSMRFFEEVFARRPDIFGPQPQPAQPWYGDPDSLAIGPHVGTRPPVVAGGASWLPSRAFAEAWQEFSRKGWVTDTTPPPPPGRLAIRPIANGVMLNWTAEADIETGIREFRIYGDGKLIDRAASLRGRDGDREPFWQLSSVDQPAIPASELTMRFPWRGAAYQTYQVTTVNNQGIESAPSAVVHSP